MKKNSRRLLYGFAAGILLLMFLVSLDEPLFRVSYSPVLYDRDGQLLGAKVAADGQWRFPGTGSLNEKFTAALIEAEDNRFRMHPGVDPFAIGRALVQNIRGGKVVSGGSTLTMQTIRLSRGQTKRSLLEKCVEAVLALRLELGTTKDEILALYAENAPFGANVVGLEAAAWRWFGRSPDDLSWAEAATLAVLPNNPALIHPGRNRNTLKEKRDSLLQKLFAAGRFDRETLALSLAESLPGEPLPLPRLAPHLLERLAADTKTQSGTGGRSTVKADIQERARAILNRASLRFAENGVMNGACLVINTQTGETAAYVGNTDTAHAGSVDIIMSPRSSGSLLKPFLYAAMLDTGDILPSSLVSDIPTRVGSYSPKNITRQYLGAVPADEALARSLNIPAVRSLRVYGVDRFARFLRSLGVSTLFRAGDDYGLPLILGGAEITLWEITGLYAGLGRSVYAPKNNRVVRQPSGFEQLPLENAISQPQRREIAGLERQPTGLSNKSNGEAPVFFAPHVFPNDESGGISVSAKPSVKRPISPGAAWLTLEALLTGVRPGEEAVWQEYGSARHIAWKTGTSFGFRDAWAVGVTPEWTVGVWIGNATGEGRAELRSAITAAPVLFEVLSALDSLGNNRGTWFPQPAAELRAAEVCAVSGFPAGVHCAKTKIIDLPLNAPAGRPCPFCRTVIVNEAMDRRVSLDAGSALKTVEAKWFVLPPAEEWYYRRWNLDYKPLPRELAAAEQPGRIPQGEAALALFNPEPNGQVYVPLELDGSEGRIVFSAAHRDTGEIIHWHLDGAFLGSTSVYHEMEARPLPGRHTLTLVDSRGNTLVRTFTVLDRESA